MSLLVGGLVDLRHLLGILDRHIRLEFHQDGFQRLHLLVKERERA